MAVSPFADCVALATTAGLFVVDLLDAACHVTRLPCTLRSLVTAITWNAATSEVGGVERLGRRMLLLHIGLSHGLAA
jgi:hypothetical protein